MSFPFEPTGAQDNNVPWRMRFLPFPILQSAVNEAATNNQSAYLMNLMCSLSAASLATQGLAWLKLPYDSIVPLSLNCMVVAESGERKSSTAKVFFRAFFDAEAESRASLKKKSSDYRRDEKAWKKERSNLVKKLEEEGSIASESGEAILSLFDDRRPKKPVELRLIYQDVTVAALYKSLHAGFPSAGLVSTEGGDIFNNSAFKDFSKLNLSWDGAEVRVDRASGNSYIVDGAKLCLSIMVQPKVLEKFLKKDGDQARGSGLWARFIVMQSMSIPGTRTVNNFTTSWQHCDAFSERVKQLVDENVELVEAGREPVELKLSLAAERCYADYFNYTEHEQRIGGRYEHARDHAAKLPENAARVAAVLHYFEGVEGDISETTLMAAIDICDEASFHFTDMFVPPPEELQDACLLSADFDKYRQKRQIESKTKLRQCAPNKLRGKRFYRALEVLELLGIVAVWSNEGTEMVNLFGPNFGSGIPVVQRHPPYNPTKTLI